MNQFSQAQRPSVAVDVGGLIVAFHFADTVLSELARRRYRQFLASAAPHLSIEVEFAHLWFHRPAESPRLERVGESRFELCYGALTAQLDFATGTGRAQCPCSVYVLDSLLRLSLTLLALEHRSLLLHSSGFLGGQGAVVCFGPSGVGKSTVARSVDPDRVLSDEIVLLSANDTEVRASGTPFHGDYSACAPLTGRVRSLVRLRQSTTDGLCVLSPGRGVSALLGATLFFCRDEALGRKLLELAAQIVRLAPVSILNFQRGTHVPTFLEQHAPLRVATDDAPRQSLAPASARR